MILNLKLEWCAFLLYDSSQTTWDIFLWVWCITSLKSPIFSVFLCPSYKISHGFDRLSLVHCDFVTAENIFFKNIFVRKDEREKFDNGKWVMVEKNEYSKVVKLEANVWIAIYNVFMEPECRKKYELSEFRKSNLLRVNQAFPKYLSNQYHSPYINLSWGSTWTKSSSTRFPISLICWGLWRSYQLCKYRAWQREIPS